MDIITCCKVVRDDELIKVNDKQELIIDEVPWKISAYDLNAIEVGKKLAEKLEGKMQVLTLGSPEALNGTKIQKDILSRGPAELNMVVGEGYEQLDSISTAWYLAQAITTFENVDLVLCGVGSGDFYNQTVGTQMGTFLNWPNIDNVVEIEIDESASKAIVKRALEDSTETYEIPLPAVITVSSEIIEPSVPTMKEIMRAGRKPVNLLDLNAESLEQTTEVIEIVVPDQTDRRKEIIEGDGEEEIDQLIEFLKKELV
ncbi:MAG TPA: electron transfer flavoprotein subunit alpha [Clostridiaceae bacterium]|nr:electron transfer flavoprotein subunit alpha [Clostridiaceae bacterium]